MLGARIVFTLLLVHVAIVPSFAPGAQPVRPYRVVVVIGDQWDDPFSYLVDKPGGLSSQYSRKILSTRYSTGEHTGYGNTPIIPGPADFYHLVVLLKSWGIPFDVIRLDQQFLDRNMFIGPDGEPLYGSIIWAVNDSEKLLHPDYDIIRDVVATHGIGFIAIFDRIQPVEIQALLGIKYNGSWAHSSDLVIARDHFLTKGLQSPLDHTDGPKAYKQRIQVELEKGVAVIKQGPYPQVTVRTLPSNAHVVWIGSDYNLALSYQAMRTLLRRAIIWTLGYGLYHTWDDIAIMIMDDPGTAQSAWLEHWHYPTLSAEAIEKYLIEPLQAHNAMLNLNLVPGFVNDESRRVEPTWTQNFVDEFGVRQNYLSTKEGIDKGLELGVFEILCHGLTHMQPDLTSPPGWWDSDLDQERAEVGWYREFGDTRRGKEIPAAEQLWRMKTAQSWLEYQFGVTPLGFCPGGFGTSNSYPNHTWRIAGQAGFGWLVWGSGYLGKDMAVVGWDFYGTSEAPLFVAAPPDAHDFGIATDPEEFASVFDQHPQRNFIGHNEFIGYLHANNSGRLVMDKVLQFTLSVHYDDHYCQHFKEHSSNWSFEMADWLVKDVGNELSIRVDGHTLPVSGIAEGAVSIPIPAGLGMHQIKISR